MGSGIAQVCAQVGCAVALYDIDDDAVGRGRKKIEAFLQKGVDRGKVAPDAKEQTLARIRTTTKPRS